MDILGRFLALFLSMAASSANAQFFFTDTGYDPATGVDRGSATQVARVERRTGFLTFSSTGAEEIGPYGAAVVLAWPDAVATGDQFDLVTFVSGPSDEQDWELIAIGASYRYELPETGMTFQVSADHGEFRLGSDMSRALGVKGEQTNVAVALRKEWLRPGHVKITGSLELAGRNYRSEVLGMTNVDESLRLLRAAVRYDSGFPFGLRTRLGASVTKGLSGFGASASDNPPASSPGASADFLRAAFSAEASVPLSARFLVNLGAIAQWTEDSLPVSQRCGYGTNAYARGFDRSYVNGDRCLGGRGELAYNFVLPDPHATRLDLRQGFGGLDGGWVEDVANPLVTGNEDNWSSLSVGYRMAYGDFIGEVAVTHILDLPDGAFPQDDTRLWFQAALRF